MNIDIKSRLHEAQFEILSSLKRFVIFVAGRRFGKTHLATEKALDLVLSKKARNILLVSPTYAQSMISYHYFMIHFYTQLNKQCKGFVKEYKSEKKFYFPFLDVTIFFKSGDNPDSLVGPGYDYILFEECGLLKEEVYNLLMPTLLDNGGGAWYFGTPRGKAHWFYKIWQRAKDEPQLWDFFHFTTHDNPLIAKEDIKILIGSLPEQIVKQEIFADFLDDGLGVFNNIREAVKDMKFVTKSKKKFYFGLDLAKINDFTVLYGISEDFTEYYYERFNQVDYKYQIRKITQALEGFVNHYCCIDSTGVGEPIFEALEDNGLNVLSYKLTNESKFDLINSYQLNLRHGKFYIVDEMLDEHDTFTIKYTKTRKIKYEAEGDKHDDKVIAGALANWAMHKGNFDYIKSVEYSDIYEDLYGEEIEY